jgi:hypothetical protein
VLVAPFGLLEPSGAQSSDGNFQPVERRRENVPVTDDDWCGPRGAGAGPREDLLPNRVWALRKGGHDAAINPRPVPGIGTEIVLTLDGEWRKTRLFRTHEQAYMGFARVDRRAAL